MFEQPGPHELELRNYFGESANYSGGAQTSNPLVLMAFTNRCGSNLLGEYLRGMEGTFAGFLELLIHYRVIDRCKSDNIRSPAEYLLRLQNESPAPLFGYKVNAGQLAMIFRLGLDRLFPSVKVIHITRDDVLGQAISFSIADQTKVWWSLNEPTGITPSYNYEDIRQRLTGIIQANGEIPVIAEIGGADCHRVTYEDLLDAPLREMQTIADFVRVPRPEALAPPRISKQASEINDAFRDQFLRDCRSKMGL